MKYIVEMIMDGKPVRKISHNGNVYLPVVLGKTFTLSLRNNSNKRALAVVSVDGVNVLDASSAKTDGIGYVIQPWQTIHIDGWRKDMQNVASFEVTEQDGSYASKTGRPNNVGVIGVAFYDEKFYPTSPKPFVSIDGGSGDIKFQSRECKISCFSGQSFNADFSPAPTKAGTGYGSQRYSPVHEVTFEKDVTSKQVVVLYYDTVESLIAQGVPVELNKSNPFPGEPARFFCPPPPK